MKEKEIIKNSGIPSERKWNTALYIRSCLKCDKNNKNVNIVMQKEALQSFLLDNPEFKLFDIYIDNGYSGLNFYRPEFLRMIDDVNDKKIDCIIVSDISRLGRNVELVENYVDNVFPKNKVRFIALNNNFDSLKETKEDNFKNLNNLLLEYISNAR